MPLPRSALATLVLLGSLSAFPPARAAESYDNCTGFVDSVPTTITTQGVWCLRKDLSVAIVSGSAITIAANNVTIDCNDFKLGGLAAGNSSGAYGIRANNRQNARVRHCNVRGFRRGIYLDGAGHLAEDNRLDNNLAYGIYVSGDNNLVQRNLVYDTGGATGLATAYGIHATADIVDNTVSGLLADVAGGYLYGIVASGTGPQVRDNKVSGFDMTAVQGGAVDGVLGIDLASNSRIRASGNHVTGSGGTNGFGIFATSSHACIDNSVSGFTTNIHNGCNSSGNVTW